MRRLRIRAKGLNIATLESRRRLPPGAAAAAWSPCEKENRNKASVAGYAKVSLIRTVFFFLSPFRWISIRTGFSCH